MIGDSSNGRTRDFGSLNVGSIPTSPAISMEIPTYEEILPYIEQKLVSEQKHLENEDVRIFNYTQKCQFAQEWNDTTRQCRGLIMNVKTGEILARPFPKFFNYGEHVSKGWAIPTSRPEIYEKLDGSLGILYALNGKEWIATRGSFTSDQALWATKWWRDNIPSGRIEGDATELFEIVYPENRIVVNYNYSGLVHLATIRISTGETLQRKWPEPIRSAKRYQYDSISELEALDEPNSEGFVVFYPQENVRMKIKFPEYVRLHKIVTGVSEIGIWEHLKDGKDLSDLLEKVPDEFFKWVEDVQFNLYSAYRDIDLEATEHFARIKELMNSPLVGGGARKEWAEQIQRMKHPGIGFAMLDSKPYEQMIWKMVRPSGSKVFKTDIDL